MRQYLIALPSLFVAFLIFGVSVYRASQITYSFSPTPAPTSLKIINNELSYKLPTVGFLSPKNMAWPLRAAIDRISVSVATNNLTLSSELLRLADERLVSAVALIQQGEVEIGVSTLGKAEKYLERSLQAEIEARADGYNTKQMLEKLSAASLAHKAMIEQIAQICSDDARAIVNKLANYPQLVFEQTAPLVVATDESLVEGRIH